MICAICGKKQSAIFSDHSISENLKDIKICGTCFDYLKQITDSNYYDISCRKEAYDYFKQYLNIIEESRAEKYLSQILCDYENQVEIEKQEIAKQTEKKLAAQKEQEQRLMFPMTNGFNFEGKIITKYLKVITSEYVIGTGLVSEVKASFSDVFGVENEAFKKKMQCARDYVTADLINEAVNLGADAIIGVNFTYTTFSGNLIAVIINGTAVNTKPCPPLE